MTEGAEKSFEVINKTLNAVDALCDVARYNEQKYHFDKLRTYARALFERGPFRVGDRVRLTKTPVITPEKAWGWMGAKHFLVEGALATVRYVDFHDGYFGADLVFDDETWVSPLDGKKHEKDRPSLYRFWETSLERVAPSALPSVGDDEP